MVWKSRFQTVCQLPRYWTAQITLELRTCIWLPLLVPAPGSTVCPVVPSETSSLLVWRRVNPSSERRCSRLSSFVRENHIVEEKATIFTSKVSIYLISTRLFLIVHVFLDNAGVIVNPKGEMKGSGITGPVAKEAADLWPKISGNAGSICWSRRFVRESKS